MWAYGSFLGFADTCFGPISAQIKISDRVWSGVTLGSNRIQEKNFNKWLSQSRDLKRTRQSMDTQC